MYAICVKIIIFTGGWALVYGVEDVSTGKEYALKVQFFLNNKLIKGFYCHKM